MKRIDVRIQDEGTIVLMYAMSRAARVWMRANVAQDGQRWGQAYVVEHRYAMAILQGLIGDGLTIGRAYGVQ